MANTFGRDSVHFFVFLEQLEGPNADDICPGVVHGLVNFIWTHTIPVLFGFNSQSSIVSENFGHFILVLSKQRLVRFSILQFLRLGVIIKGHIAHISLSPGWIGTAKLRNRGKRTPEVCVHKYESIYHRSL